MIMFLGELHGEVLDPVLNNLRKQDRDMTSPYVG